MPYTATYSSLANVLAAIKPRTSSIQRLEECVRTSLNALKKAHEFNF